MDRRSKRPACREMTEAPLKEIALMNTLIKKKTLLL